VPEAVIVSAFRTPIGTAKKGALRDTDAYALCSLGHPVAASGARMLVPLVHELRRRGGGVGVAAMCAGGGMGSATVIEVPAS